jgi:glycogen debranching enzyme
LGLSRYGLKEHAMRLMAALFDASLSVDLNRLPELFCGFARRPGEGPTLYPVACSPQSWAAAAPFLLIKAVLGMNVLGAEARVVFQHAALPPFLDQVMIRNLRVASSTADIALHRHPEDVGFIVSGRRGPVEIVTIK